MIGFNYPFFFSKEKLFIIEISLILFIIEGKNERVKFCAFILIIYYRTNLEEFDKESISYQIQNVRIKGKNDLDEPSTEGTLLRELFFRKPSLEESESLDIIPVLSETDLQTKHSTNTMLFS